jgi:hypothetical protein
VKLEQERGRAATREELKALDPERLLFTRGDRRPEGEEQPRSAHSSIEDSRLQAERQLLR